MREGLRSSVNLSAKMVKDEVSPSKLNKKDCELTGDEKPKLNQEEASGEEIEVDQRDGFKIEECGGGSDMGECDAVENCKSRRKRTRGASEGESEDGSLPKDKNSDGSEKRWAGVKKKDSEASDHEEGKTLKRKRGRPSKAQKSDGSEKTRIKEVKEESNPYVGRESEQPDNEVRENLKPKRGRPPKAKKSDESEKKSIEAVEDDTAESSGEESDGSYGKVGKKLKPKRGRHSKFNKGIMVGGLRKRQWGKKTGHNTNHNVGARSALSGGKRSNATELATTRKIKFSNDGKEEGRNKQKAAVREKIIELLLGAGWTIEHRARNGREYCDAVYVNPEGRTHWSVTLAYRVLKQHYEGVGGDSHTCKTGFKFTPLPDDELSILTKVMGKERSDKNKKKRKWNQCKGGKTGEGVAKLKNKKGKLYKRKLDAAATPGRKKLKDWTNHKSSLSEQDGCSGTLDDGTAVKDRKQLKTNNRKRCALMIRNSKEGADSNGDGYVLCNGKRTVLAWMIDLGSVPLAGKVQYLKPRKTRMVLGGKITTDGIRCDCCSETFAILDFESHAGSKSCQPLKNICLDNGHSLLQCQLESWNKQDESDRKGFHFVDTDGQDPNDDTCGTCGDGGDLICCDSCPSTFHQSCLDIKKFPSGVWNCTYCSCKFCGMAAGDTCQMDENDAASQHALLACCSCEEKCNDSIFIVFSEFEVEQVPVFGTCCNLISIGSESDCNLVLIRHGIVFAFAANFTSSFGLYTLFIYPEFSVCCNSPKWFCFCQLYDKLQALLGVKHEMEDGFAWTLVRRFDVGSDISLSGMHRKVECNSKVAVALHIMDECFLPMPDHRSGVNLIRNIVYNFGSNFNRLDYSGFLTAILERGDEIISVASIRMHGNHLAEMPFIGTRHMYRRQGMCRRLLSAIETALCSLNVEKLVIPAISELRETWTSVFGFKPLEGSSKQKMRNVKMVAFPGVDMLQKTLLRHHQFAEANMSPAEGSMELKEHHTMDETSSNSDDKCSPVRFDLKVSTDSKREVEENAHMNQSGVSEVESQLSGISFMGSEVADSQGQCQFASREDTETVPCEVKVEDSSGRQNHDPVHATSEIVTSQLRHLVSDLEFEVSGTNAAHRESTTGNISCDAVQSKTTPPIQKVQDDGNGHWGVLSVNQNISFCQGKEPISKEIAALTIIDPNSDVTAKPDPQSCRSNGFCFATEIRVSSCGVDADRVHDIKEVLDTVQSDAISPYGGSIFYGPQMNIKSSDHANSVSEAEPASLTESISEPSCNSSSAPAVGLHCASGSGNSCSAPEALVANEEFQHILRVLNTNVDGKQKIMFALTSIKGIGRRLANIVCKKADVDMNKRAGELSAEELDKLMTIVANPRQFKIPDWFLNRQKDYKDGKYSQVVSNALDMKLRDDLERLKKISFFGLTLAGMALLCRNHRGLRHYWGLRVRGQHTKTTGRRGKTVGVSKKR
ncbi:hypothetical protein SADUNF_Sadunf02G0043400 [Salix dunnii]|uniref:PHD-type domain-containing protein n=1 Tax=Salix dunnii TaxID=1413687 RepID=A0A835N697_9ROSI|nr:hypothetical protein SADUNF_Sadunf02G0043400 [Salix dunnii]